VRLLVLLELQLAASARVSAIHLPPSEIETIQPPKFPLNGLHDYAVGLGGGALIPYPRPSGASPGRFLGLLSSDAISPRTSLPACHPLPACTLRLPIRFIWSDYIPSIGANCPRLATIPYARGKKFLTPAY
jgi:hypothetical protein